MTTPLIATPEVWTVSIVLRSDTNETRADAFLQGPPVELESRASAPSRRVRRPRANSTSPPPKRCGDSRVGCEHAPPSRARPRSLDADSAAGLSFTDRTSSRVRHDPVRPSAWRRRPCLRGAPVTESDRQPGGCALY
jgi:hypothetical protein